MMLCWGWGWGRGKLIKIGTRTLDVGDHANVVLGGEEKVEHIL